MSEEDDEKERENDETNDKYVYCNAYNVVHFVVKRERERRKEGRGNSQETLPFSFTHFVILHFCFCLSFRRCFEYTSYQIDQMLQKYTKVTLLCKTFAI